MINIELVMSIIAIALDINRKTDKAAFVHVSGHVNTIHVDISPSKENYLEYVYSNGCKLDDTKELKDMLHSLLLLRQ